MTRRFEELEVFQRAYKVSLEMHRHASQIRKWQYASPTSRGGKGDRCGCQRPMSRGINPGQFGKGFGKRAKLRQPNFKRFIQMSIGSADEIARMDCATVIDLGYQR